MFYVDLKAAAAEEYGVLADTESLRFRMYNIFYILRYFFIKSFAQVLGCTFSASPCRLLHVSAASALYITPSSPMISGTPIRYPSLSGAGEGGDFRACQTVGECNAISEHLSQDNR